MNDLYSLTFFCHDGRITYNGPVLVDNIDLEEYSKDEMERTGFLVLLNPSVPSYSIVGNYPTIFQFSEIFLLGLVSRILPVEDEESAFKSFVLSRYDLTIDKLDKDKKDPVTVRFKPKVNE